MAILRSLLPYFLSICSLCAANSLQGQNIFDSTNSYSYAYYLFQSNNYNLAAREMERLHFLFPDNDTLKILLLKSYRKGEQLMLACERMDNLAVTQSDMQNSWEKEKMRTLLVAGKYQAADSMLAILKYHTMHERQVATCLKYCYELEWEKAKKVSDSAHFSQQPQTEVVSELLIKQQSEKYRKPWVAATFSAIVPGTGKVYAGRWKDGLMSFIFVGANAFQAYRAFNQRGVKSTRGWIFATVGTGFYLGNIYGSYYAARIRNKKINDKYLLQINNNIDTLY